MCLVFVVVGPPSWRWLFGRTARGSYALRLAVYAAIGAATVLGLAWLVPASLGMRVSLLTDRAGLVVTLVLFWVGGFGLGRDIELELSLERERARNAELAQAAQQAQLLALQSQLDPHFLFNTLNAIAEWC
ncbi:MAG: histidine kinase, partial [Myxococcales bacterium]|nr:histidine kinase [Myxococcales bacterium]